MSEQPTGGQTVPLEPLVGLPAQPCIEDALLYSRNYANASPYLNNTAREHIFGLCDLLEANNEQTKRLRAALLHAREVLAEFHHAGDVPDSLEVIDAALQPNAEVEPTQGRQENLR